MQSRKTKMGREKLSNHDDLPPDPLFYIAEEKVDTKKGKGTLYIAFKQYSSQENYSVRIVQ